MNFKALFFEQADWVARVVLLAVLLGWLLGLGFGQTAAIRNPAGRFVRIGDSPRLALDSRTGQLCSTTGPTEGLPACKDLALLPQ